MNWKLIVVLSLFGLAMGFATVYFVSAQAEPFYWLCIFVVSAFFVARNCWSNYFLHGLFTGLLNAGWIILIHLLLFNTYLANHPVEAKMITDPSGALSPKMVIVVMGMIAGALSGCVLGLFCYIASRMLNN